MEKFHLEAKTILVSLANNVIETKSGLDLIDGKFDFQENFQKIANISHFINAGQNRIMPCRKKTPHNCPRHYQGSRQAEGVGGGGGEGGCK